MPATTWPSHWATHPQSSPEKRSCRSWECDRRRRGLNGALVFLGLDPRAGLFRRVHRLVDADRPIRPAPGAWSLWALIFLAVILLPQLRAAVDAAPAGSQNSATEAATQGQASAKQTASDAQTRKAQEFTLRVVGPDGKPVPRAVVELHTYPDPAIDEVRRASSSGVNRTSVSVATDDQGELAVELRQAPINFNVDITIPGFGPYFALVV